MHNYVWVALIAAPLAGACALDEAPDDELATDSSELISVNALANNALANNALANNALANNALANNALANNGLVPTGSISGALCSNDANSRNGARSFFSYLTSCALPASSSVTINCTNGQASQTFPGQLGLAPGWASGPPTLADKHIVSSCMIARVNRLQNIINLSLRGSPAALAPSAYELEKYDTKEGAFYGNLFTVPVQAYACTIAGAGQQVGRGCGQQPGACAPVVAVGSCAAACPLSNTNYYTQCWNPADTQSFQLPITVWLTDFTPPLAG